MAAVEANIQEELDPQALLAAAAEELELSDFGGERFIEGMTSFLRAAALEGNLSEAGVMGIKMNTLRLLMNRLRFQADLNNHPEILDEDVSGPVVILGMARTGTTKLQRMLSRDPGVQGMWFYRLLEPTPAEGWSPGEPDPRLDLARVFVEMLLEQHPDWMDGHPTYADEVDEEAFLMEMSFESLISPYRARVPTYVDWWLAQPRDHAYEYLRSLVQYLQWQDGGRRDRPFVMKSPVHTGNIDLVARMFPNPTIVHCHRDPKVSIPSTARLVESLRRMFSDTVDHEEIGDLVLRWSAAETARCISQRSELANGLKIIDVQFEDVVRDPYAVIRAIYERWERPFTPEAEAEMAAWLQSDPHVKTHAYSLERYGLTAEQVDKEFAEYIELFVPGGH